MTKQTGPLGRLLARNTILNLFGQGLPLIVGVLTAPAVVRGLGLERYGILAMALVVLGYFGLFDLGLGRAATRFVATAIESDTQDRVPAIVWTAVMVQIVLGVLGAAILIGLTPLLVDRVLNIPPQLLREARASFYILACSIPAVLLSGSLRGVLEGAQRFDLVNAAAAPLSAANFLVPYIGVTIGWGLPGIVGTLLASRTVGVVLFYLLCIHVFPSLRTIPRFHAREARLLVSYGGWVSVSSLVGPTLVYVDRFMLGILVTMTAVTYYAAPYEMVTRLLIVPVSLAGALFPAFTGIHQKGNIPALENLVATSIKYLLIALAPLLVLLLAFAGDALRIWLGPDFARESTLALQILAVGVFTNSMALLPFALIQGAGRPDVTAKIHLAEVPIQLVVAWFLVSRWGVNGAALAWTIRTTLDMVLLTVAAFRISSISRRSFMDIKIPHVIGCVATLALVATASHAFIPSLQVRALIVTAFLGWIGMLIWYRLLSERDRNQITRLFLLNNPQ